MAAETMTPEARRAKADYMKEWRRKNKDKVRSYEAKHWQKIADQTAAERDQTGDE